MRLHLQFMIPILALISCNNVTEQTIEENGKSIIEIPSPVNKGGEPNLFTADDGQLYFSWIETDNDSTHSLKFSILKKDKWSAPKTVASGSNWFVNWADFPSLVPFKGDHNNLAAHWLQMRAEGTYDYDVRIALSNDGGTSWSDSFIPHKDGIAAEHGFVSMVPLSADRIMAVWLDGRNTKTGEAGHGDGHGHGHGGAMTLRTASFDPEGNIYDEVELDNKVCDCCQTSAALTSEGPIVVYRDRSDSEVRDISVVRKVNGNWTDSYPVHNDLWTIEGCPVNGPSIVAEGKAVAVAWFTMAKDKGEVKLAFSDDAGANFGTPVIVDDSNPIGRVDVILLESGCAFVSWLEASGELMGAVISPSGIEGEKLVMTMSDASRKSGFPVLGKSGEKIILAWTQVDSLPTVKTGMISGY